MKAEYAIFPPQITHDVEIVEQRDGDRRAFIVGSASAGRFILLRETECKVLRLLDGTLTSRQVCEKFSGLYEGRLALPTLQKFLGRLDEAGVLAGPRKSVASHSNLMPGPQFYVRWKLSNPDRLFDRIVPLMRWVWTQQFVIVTLLLMCLAVFLSVSRSAEVSSYALYTLREHYLAIFIAGLLVGFSHEFAHGLTCKAFGGRVREVGVLMIYYLLPALYCNVSGAYLIPESHRRLWVILAGIYWQLLVGVLALLSWFTVEPHTVISDLAFILFLGSVLDVIFNANPLIKLDGYYFISQWMRLPNLMDRSRSYWRGLLKHALYGEVDDSACRWSRRERAVYAAFGLTSFGYTVVLRGVIVFYVGAYLADQFNIAGLVVAAGLGAFYMRKPLAHVISMIGRIVKQMHVALSRLVREDAMTKADQGSDEGITRNEGVKRNVLRRRIVWLAIAIITGAVLCLPWEASVGSYGTLAAMPGLEAVVRAPEDGTLTELRVQPGDVLAGGSLIGRMSNLGLDEQIVQAQSDLARSNADYERLLGELRSREESASRAELQLSRRRHEFDEINADQQQINQRLNAEAQTAELVRVSSRSYRPSAYPAAIAMLEADVDVLQVRLQEASARSRRLHGLFDQGVVPQSEIESARTRADSLSLELVRARERLESGLIEHRRKYTGSSIELQQANSDLRVEHLQGEQLGRQLRAARELSLVLESRLELLRRKRAQFELVTPCAGTVYGEELSRMAQRYFEKGEEICRVADADHLLVRIQIPEREIGDVRVNHHVRLRVRAHPDRVFRGVVSKIGGESERDEHNQATYRVELSIQNTEGLLRPGMTAFARVDFGRQMIGQILAHKIRQLLRPEMWML